MKLNLGAGDHELEEWQNVDITNPENPVDLAVFPWNYDVNTADEILASHILEHFDRITGVSFLQECYRILKPGGVLHLAVPDMDLFIGCINDKNWIPIHGYKWRSLDMLLGGGLYEPDPRNRHYYLYCFASLAWTLENVGFVNIKRRNTPKVFDNTDHQSITLYMDAVKP
jgi:SAM-dependent methyltransferase